TLAKPLLDSAQPLVLQRPLFARVPRIARRLRVPLCVPANRDVNEPGFVASIRTELRADAGLNLYGTQIFGPQLLGAFPGGVANYHNGSLPGYRGVGATAWSIYRGELATGFTFHRMTVGIDEGPILVEDAIPVQPGATLDELEWKKTVGAAALVPSVLDALVHGDPGRPQAGEPTYFSFLDRREITHIPNPSNLTYVEIERRLRAFGGLRMRLDGKAYGVTRVRRAGPRGPRHRQLSFVTADGVTAVADRLDFLPPGLHRLRAALR
ncbi:MAG: hypothetical protein L0206_03585, partial [Actinobacteria bacterium]|nr:hypothetical protein [Actinomycetota bacterium]